MSHFTSFFLKQKSNCWWKVFFFRKLLLPRQSWIWTFWLHKVRELLEKIRNGGPCDPQHLVVSWSRQTKDRCWEIAVGAVTRLWAGRTKCQEVQEVSLLPKRPYRLFDPPKQPTTQFIPGTLSTDKTDCEWTWSLPHIPKVANSWSYTSTPTHALTTRTATTLLYQAKTEPYRETFLFPKIFSPDNLQFRLSIRRVPVLNGTFLQPENFSVSCGSVTGRF